MTKFAQFRGKTVLITGLTGFKGTWLATVLHRLGANVTGFGLAPTDPNALFWSEGLHEICDYDFLDITHYHSLQKWISSRSFDYVFHLAAEPLVIDCYNHPLQAYHVNALGTANLLECLRLEGFTSPVVVITTDKVYKNQGRSHAFRETDPLGGLDPYSSSKACADLITTSYLNSYFLETNNVVVARAGNVIGGGDFSENRLIPDIFKAWASSEPVRIRNMDHIRPWQHVLDVTLGYLNIALTIPNTKFNDYNLGPDTKEILSVKDVLDQVKKSIDVTVIEPPSSKYVESSNLILNCERIYLEKIWQPIFDARAAIDLTCEWYIKNLTGAGIRISDQIDRYLP